MNLLVERRADDLGSEGVAMCSVERFAVVKLQMCGEREHKETVYGPDRDCPAVRRQIIFETA